MLVISILCGRTNKEIDILKVRLLLHAAFTVLSPLNARFSLQLVMKYKEKIL